MTRHKLYRPHLLERVEVEWNDARVDLDYDGAADRAGLTLAHLLNVGYFVSMGKDRIVLASCHDADDKTVRHLITIPRVQVKVIRSLEPKGGDSGPQES